jgi:uncharacterized membrane protein YkoI
MRYLAATLAAAALLTFGAVPPAVNAGGKAVHEEKISLDQVPAPVRATFEKEAQGGTLGDISKETKGGKTYYEARITKNGKDRYVNVAADGKVMKRESAKKEAKEQSKAAR